MSLVTIQANSSNQLTLDDFQSEMTQYLAWVGSRASINCIMNPSQPDLEIIIMKNGMFQN
jgi:hypothetical protein